MREGLGVPRREETLFQPVIGRSAPLINGCPVLTLPQVQAGWRQAGGRLERGDQHSPPPRWR